MNIFGEEIISTSIGGDPFAEDVLDWRKNALEMKHEAMLLPSDIETKCIRLVKSYGLNYAALDLVENLEGEIFFLEANPNGQWAWIEPLTGQKLTESLINLLCRRC